MKNLKPKAKQTIKVSWKLFQGTEVHSESSKQFEGKTKDKEAEKYLNTVFEIKCNLDKTANGLKLSDKLYKRRGTMLDLKTPRFEKTVSHNKSIYKLEIEIN